MNKSGFVHTLSSGRLTSKPYFLLPSVPKPPSLMRVGDMAPSADRHRPSPSTTTSFLCSVVPSHLCLSRPSSSAPSQPPPSTGWVSRQIFLYDFHIFKLNGLEVINDFMFPMFDLNLVQNDSWQCTSGLPAHNTLSSPRGIQNYPPTVTHWTGTKIKQNSFFFQKNSQMRCGRRVPISLFLSLLKHVVCGSTCLSIAERHLQCDWTIDRTIDHSITSRIIGVRNGMTNAWTKQTTVAAARPVQWSNPSWSPWHDMHVCRLISSYTCSM
jgi:hypothetical protein